MGRIRKLIATVCGEFPEFIIFSGYDENLVHNVISGGEGCIGGLSNLYPEIFAKLVKAINEKDPDTVESCQRIVDKMMNLYDIGVPFIPIMKKAMMLRGDWNKGLQCKTVFAGNRGADRKNQGDDESCKSYLMSTAYKYKIIDQNERDGCLNRHASLFLIGLKDDSFYVSLKERILVRIIRSALMKGFIDGAQIIMTWVITD